MSRRDFPESSRDGEGQEGIHLGLTRKRAPCSHIGMSEKRKAGGEGGVCSASSDAPLAEEGGEGSQRHGGEKQEGPPAVKVAKVSRSFHLSRHVREDHGQPIFGLAMNLGHPRRNNLFATAGSNRATIYELMPGGDVEARHVYVDQDEVESYFTVAWSFAAWADDAPLLAVAGQLGIVRVLDCSRQCVARTLMGHGNSINELRFHPYKPQLLLSASKDQSIRLWDVRCVVCVAIFSGDQGHSEEVLSLDMHLDGEQFVSGGMDNAVKVWSLEACASAIEEASKLPSRSMPDGPTPTGGEQASGSFRPMIIQKPQFSTTKVHGNYVDCVRWHGDYIFSKSTHHKVVVWKPMPISDASKEGAVKVLADCKYTNSEIWFLRFSLGNNISTSERPFMAVGNKVGHIFIWDLANIVDGGAPVKLAHSKCKTTVRQTAISADSRTILAVTQDGSLWRWDAK